MGKPVALEVKVPTSSKRPNKRQELATLAQRYTQAQQAVERKTLELSRLQEEIATREAAFQALLKECGARKERVDVVALRGPPNAKQVGSELALQIRRRQARRKEMLRHKLDKLRTKLGDSLACNRELREEIDDRRRARVHHLAAVKMGGCAVVRSEGEIGDLITAAQRAYAEKDMCRLRLAELSRKSDDECAVIDQRMAECDREISEIDEAMRQRDAEVEEMQRETNAAVAEARREEEAREREMEHFASVRNQRLEVARSVDEMFAALRVNSMADLKDSFKTTAAKVLSLWQKQAEQEAEVELLEQEIRSIQEEVEEKLAQRAAESSSGGQEKAEHNERLDEANELIDKREKVLQQLCDVVRDAFETLEPLKSQHGPLASDVARVTPHSLLTFLSLLELTAISLVRKRTVELMKTNDPLLSMASVSEMGRTCSSCSEIGEENAPPPGVASHASASAINKSGTEDSSSKPASPGKRKGSRKRITIVPPSMGANTLPGTFTHEPSSKKGGGLSSASNGEIGTLKYNRSSLRSELMSQIMQGVSGHMEKLTDEEILVKAGEKSRDRSPGSHDTAPAIDKAQRDTAIDVWLLKRRGEGRGGSAKQPPPADQRQMKSRSAPSQSRHGQSAPSLFSSPSSNRELVDNVALLNRDPKIRKDMAAKLLPKVQSLPPLSEEGRCRVGVCSRAEAAAPPACLPESAPLIDPEYEIAEINRRLAHLQVERQQIHELKEMALAASNLTGSNSIASEISMARSTSLSVLPPARNHQRSATSLPPARR